MLSSDKADRCPRCGSDNVEVGAIVLACQACDWHHLNEYPCRVCGEPSRSAVGTSGLPTLYGCRSHPLTEAEKHDMSVEFWRQALLDRDQPEFQRQLQGEWPERSDHADHRIP